MLTDAEAIDLKLGSTSLFMSSTAVTGSLLG